MQTTYDDTTFTLTSGHWSATYPLAEIAKWLGFYRHQKERFPHSKTSYDRSILALEALQSELMGKGLLAA